MIVLSVSCLTALSSLAVDVMVDPTYGHATGLKIPTAQDLEIINRLPRVKGVRLTSLGLERLNAYRQSAGLQALSSATISTAAPGQALILSDDTNTINTLVASSTSTAVDNSTLPAFPPIKNQESLSSCAAFSSTYYQMTHMTALARGWNAKTGGDAFRFSPKWTYNLINDGYDSGSSLSDSLAIMRDHGCATWADFPYVYTGATTDYTVWCMTPAVWSNAISYRLNNYSVIDSLYTSNGLALLKASLDNGYVLTFSTYSPFPYYQGWAQGTVADDPATTDDNAFKGQLICTYVRPLDWGHAMTIVGYNDNIWCDLNGNGTVDAGEKGALKIANSWGSGWGNSGYAWFAYDAINKQSAVAGFQPSNKVYGIGYNNLPGNCLAYAIDAKPSYDPRFLARFTVFHATRNQLDISIGKDNLSATNNPHQTWQPTAWNYSGGSYALDGSTIACDGTFYVDLTDLAPEIALPNRYFLTLSVALGVGRLKSCSLIDNATHQESTITAPSPTAFNPASGIVTGRTAWAWIDMGLPGFSTNGSALPWMCWLTNSFTPLELANTNSTGPLSDPDGDGYCNLLEYAFNSNARVSTSTPSRLWVSRAQVNGNMTPVWVYARRKGATDLTYRNESSSDLSLWDTNRTLAVGITNNPDGLSETVILAPSNSPTGDTNGFFRVRVMMP